jgi:hypothetical protein
MLGVLTNLPFSASPKSIKYAIRTTIGHITHTNYVKRTTRCITVENNEQGKTSHETG